MENDNNLSKMIVSHEKLEAFNFDYPVLNLFYPNRSPISIMKSSETLKKTNVMRKFENSQVRQCIPRRMSFFFSKTEVKILSMKCIFITTWEIS